jgi:hypothetical protein
MPADKPYWFRAKRYGWGWGLPATWQGWLVFCAYLVLVVGGALVLPTKDHVVGFIVLTVALSLGLVAICFAKGEPPKWRWGDR